MNCDICHASDPYLPKFNDKAVKYLEEKEQIVLKFKKGIEGKILCNRHYKSEIEYFFNGKFRFQSQCCDVLKIHKTKIRKTKLVTVSHDLANDARIHLGLQDLIPFQKICVDCMPKLEAQIISVKSEETIPPDDEQSTNFMENDTVVDIDFGDSDTKEVIFGNIRQKLAELDRDQQAAIIAILPSSWSNHEISSKSG